MSSLCKGFNVHTFPNYSQNKQPNQLSFQQKVDMRFRAQPKM
jgi:hypothetical protein